LTDEIPHSIAVGVDKLREERDRWAVQATIYVAKPTQKPIVVGHKGRLIRKVTRQAQAELKAMYEKEVDLEMWVKVEKNWDRNFWILRRLGYA
jgi:GTP-binding protein Era